MISATMMRKIWAVIESNQVSTLLQFDDTALVQLLLQQLRATQEIDPLVDSSLNTYIQSKLPLIRDTAEARVDIDQSDR